MINILVPYSPWFRCQRFTWRVSQRRQVKILFPRNPIEALTITPCHCYLNSNWYICQMIQARRQTNKQNKQTNVPPTKRKASKKVSEIQRLKRQANKGTKERTTDQEKKQTNKNEWTNEWTNENFPFLMQISSSCTLEKVIIFPLYRRV